MDLHYVCNAMHIAYIPHPHRPRASSHYDMNFVTTISFDAWPPMAAALKNSVYLAQSHQNKLTITIHMVQVSVNNFAVQRNKNVNCFDEFLFKNRNQTHKCKFLGGWIGRTLRQANSTDNWSLLFDHGDKCIAHHYAFCSERMDEMGSLFRPQA